MVSSARKRDCPAKTENAGVNIVVAAQPALFCETLCHRLDEEPDFSVVGRVGGKEEIEALLARENPQVLVFDYEGLGPGAESVVGRLRRRAPGMRILVLASRSSDEIVERILLAGASGLVDKQLEFAVLVRAIRAVAAGEIWADRHAAFLAFEILTGSGARAPRSNLTKREQEIADACSQGLRNKEIAMHLKISPKTVKGHLNNIFRKLHVDSRLALGLQQRDRAES